MIMKKQILTDNETKTFLAKAFKCTRQQVWRALNFERDSDLAKRIRILALKRGGKLTEGYVPQCETTHNTADRTMEQTFGPRVKIVADFQSKKDSYSNLSIAEFMQLQNEVEQMAAAL